MSKQYSFSILGTKCASCEIIIERQVKKMSGVRNVHVSHSNATLSVFAGDAAEITVEALNNILQPHGYRVLPPQEARPPLTLDLKRFGGMVVAIFALYMVASRFGLLSYSPQVEGPSGLGAVFGIGLIAAFSSCTAVLGGLLAGFAATRAKQSEGLTISKKIAPYLLFNAGRLLGFIALGAVIGFVGKSVALSPTANGLFVLGIAAVMLVLGINLIGIFSRPVFVPRAPRFLSHRIHDLTHSSNPIVPLLAGAATFFLPCGFTQSMQLYALSLGDPKAAALVMGVFALGTMPALLGISAATSLAKGAALQKMTRAAGAMVMVLGISNGQNALALLDWQWLPQREATAVASTSVEAGEQVVTMKVTSAGVYEPSVLAVQAGVPVRWDIYGDTYMGCGNTLVMRAFGINAALKTGLNQVRFTPNKPGRYAFSCAMGMIRGTMIVKPSST